MNEHPELLHPDRSQTVLFRCDGTQQTGLGHASRSLALAEAFVDLGCRCVFLGRFEAQAQERFYSAGIGWKALEESSWSAGDANALASLVDRSDACGVVIDSYSVGADYVDEIERRAAPVLLIDDFAVLPRYRCSAVLNFTSRADDFSYPRDRVRCFLGPRWFLGRRGLRQLRKQGPRPVRDARRVLVTSGGSDPHDTVLPVTEALLACDPQLSIHAVIPGGYASLPELETLLAQARAGSQVLTRLPELSSELAWADLSGRLRACCRRTRDRQETLRASPLSG
jgi:UDP-2,4-diacetamido-2,4,6-trideoxy-beta-L-altropyranose hydrolase